MLLRVTERIGSVMSQQPAICKVLLPPKHCFE